MLYQGAKLAICGNEYEPSILASNFEPLPNPFKDAVPGLWSWRWEQSFRRTPENGRNHPKLFAVKAIFWTNLVKNKYSSMKQMYCFQCFLRNCVEIVWCSAQPPTIPWQVIWTKNRSRALNLTSDHKIFLMGFSFNTNHRVWGLDTEIWNAYVALPITVGAKQLVRQLHRMAILCISDELGSVY